VVLALSDESDELVGEYVDDMGLRVRVAAGAVAQGPFMGNGVPRTYVVGPDGKILWKGHPASLNSGVLKDALKGVKKSANTYLAFNPVGEYTEKDAIKLVDLGLEGKLAKALKAAKDLAADEAGGPASVQANAYAGEVEGYVTLLKQQAESFITKREMVTGTEVLKTLANEFKGTDLAPPIEERLKEIEKDDTLSKELEADVALGKLKEAAIKKGWRKQAKKLESLIKKYEGTGAATKAKALLRKANSE